MRACSSQYRGPYSPDGSSELIDSKVAPPNGPLPLSLAERRYGEGFAMGDC